MEINTLLPEEHIFTKRLVNIAKPPKRLCFMGKLPDTHAPRVAIVGTRKPSNYGREVTERGRLHPHRLSGRGVSTRRRARCLPVGRAESWGNFL